MPPAESDVWSVLPGPLYAEQRVGDDPNLSPLILLHGFTQTSRSWDPILPHLGSTRSIIRVDLPGHGLSAHADADLNRTATLVAKTCGRGTVVGYSMGGRVALHIGLDHPASCDRLILIGATPGIVDADERNERRRQDDLLADRIERDGVPAFLEDWLANPLFAGLPKSSADLDDRLRNSADGLSASLRHCGTGTQTPLWSRLATLDMPVTVIAGARDDKFAGIGRDMVATIGARATLHLVERAGHSAHLEQPAAVAAIIASSLR